jgi:hypothetical protein
MKKKKIIKPRVSKVPKTRNNGKWTESQFWGFIRSTLRSKSRWWLPILECKKSARRAYKGENKRQKWEYLCNSCNLYFQEKFVSVDHVLPVGTLKCANDLPQFVENLFCSQENLQVLCKTCHDVKTKLDNNKTKENDN